MSRHSVMLNPDSESRDASNDEKNRGSIAGLVEGVPGRLMNEYGRAGTRNG